MSIERTAMPVSPMPTGRGAADRFLVAAAQIPETEVRQPWCDVNLAIGNGLQGARAVRPHLPALRAAISELAFEDLDSFEDLASALAVAAALVDRLPVPPTGALPLMRRSQQLRGLLLGNAETLARLGLLPAATVARIRKSKGATEIAYDCIALARLYREHADALRGRMAVTEAEIGEADEVGARLGLLLRPAGARRAPPSPELVERARTRDRLWTLFERTWEDQVWRAGAWIWRRSVARHVPALSARVVKRRKPAAAGKEVDDSPSPGTNSRARW